ncbi:hypothetical protein R3P38DRAFT_2803698 [Favolaschia claudopus]|uniref:Uncharacterized protein n=1 Tax=Favolaschia claudopus TaxID=2862362 RepID=A0AAV9Z7W3_9AGAR
MYMGYITVQDLADFELDFDFDFSQCDTRRSAANFGKVRGISWERLWISPGITLKSAKSATVIYPNEVVSAKLGSFGAIVVIARIKSGNLVLPGARRYNILAEEDTPPTYEASEPLPPYIGMRIVESPYLANISINGTPEVAGTVDRDIYSASGTCTQPTQQRGMEVGRQTSSPMPMHRAHVAAPAACELPGTIMSLTSRINGPVPTTNSVSLKPIVECDCVLARISSRSFERLKGDDQKIVRALWALTGVPVVSADVYTQSKSYGCAEFWQLICHGFRAFGPARPIAGGDVIPSRYQMSAEAAKKPNRPP